MARSRLRSGKVLHRGDQPGTAWKKKASGPIFGLKKRRQSYGLWAQAPTRQTHPHRLAERTLTIFSSDFLKLSITSIRPGHRSFLTAEPARRRNPPQKAPVGLRS